MKVAKLTITCDNGFTAFVNGNKVGGGNQWENRYEFDIKKHLRNGDNVLAVEATNEGSQAGLVAKIELTDGTARRATIVTDKQWYVTNKKVDGWMAPSINTAGWTRPVIVGKMGDGAVGRCLLRQAPRRSPRHQRDPACPRGLRDRKTLPGPQGRTGLVGVDDRR